MLQGEHQTVCKQVLLRKGGLLIANELTAKTDFLTLTFGLTDGWWLFEDAKWRIPGAPLLSRCAFWPWSCAAVQWCAELLQPCLSCTNQHC
jgi:hypothetical protein